MTAGVWKIHLREDLKFGSVPSWPYGPDGTHEQAKERRPLPPFSSSSPSLLLTRYPSSSSLQPSSDPRSMKSLWLYVRDVYKGTEVSIREHGSHKRSPPPPRVLIGNKCLVLGLAPHSHKCCHATQEMGWRQRSDFPKVTQLGLSSDIPPPSFLLPLLPGSQAPDVSCSEVSGYFYSGARDLKQQSHVG